MIDLGRLGWDARASFMLSLSPHVSGITLLAGRWSIRWGTASFRPQTNYGSTITQFAIDCSAGALKVMCNCPF